MRTAFAKLNARPTFVLGLIAALLVVAASTAPDVHRHVGGIAWLAVLLSWGLMTFVASRIAPRLPSRSALTIIFVAAGAMRLALLVEPPYLSTDIFRYVWDGRVQAAGINPYRYVPAAPELLSLRDATIYPNINRAEYAPTIYPPVAQFIFRVTHIFGDGELSMRLAMLTFEAVAIIALLGILQTLSLPPGSIVAYAWHPLPVWEIAGNGHVDVCMLALLLVGLWLYLQKWTVSAGVLISLAAFVKPTALLALPVLWRPWDWKLPAVLAVTAVLVYVPYLSAGSQVFGFLGGYVAEEGLSNGVGFRYLAMIEALCGPWQGAVIVYLLAAAVVLGGLALAAGFRSDRSGEASLRALALLLIVFMVLLTPHYPWYYLVLTPLLALGRWVTPWVLTIGGFLLYNEIDVANLPPYATREAVLHLTALAAVAVDLRHSIQHLPLALTKTESHP